MSNDRVTTDVWEQDVPAGGADLDGSLPPRAAAVAVVGIVTTRETPALACSAGAVDVPAGDTIQLIGRTPQRRRLLISAGESVVIGVHSAEQTAGGQGLYLPADYFVVPLRYAGQVWVYNPTQDTVTVSYWAEIDQG